MMDWISTLEAVRTPLLAAYYAVLVSLALFGLHRLSLLVALLRHRVNAEEPDAPAEADWPVLTVQLPIYNELLVAPRLIEAVCELDYPHDRLEIQVLDDSSDETVEVVAGVVERKRADGFEIVHIRRNDRVGFKAGALAAGQERARGSLLAIFDADFVPRPDFLRRTVPWFLGDDSQGIGMVQARWEHLNRHHSFLTRLQAILLDGHFAVEHAARFLAGHFFNFNGTAGVWRSEAITQAGGWQHDTLTEDLDLSYRAQLEGWRFIYLPHVTAPAELPADINAFKGQQRRWAMGSAQTCRKLLGRILSSRIASGTKLEATVHLTANFSYPLMVLLSAMLFPAMVVRRGTERWQLLAIDAPLFVAATLSVATFYFVAEVRAGRGVWRELTRIPGAMALGIGLCPSNAGAVLAGLWRRGGTFVRTPKARLEDQPSVAVETAPAPLSYRAPSDWALFVEVAFAAIFLAAIIASIELAMWWAIPFLLLFFHGYGLMAALGLKELISARLPRRNAVAVDSPGPELT